MSSEEKEPRMSLGELEAIAYNFDHSVLQRADVVRLFAEIRAAWEENTGLLEQLERQQEQHRRLELYAKDQTNFNHIDDLCEHGRELGCCLHCSAKGPKEQYK